MSFGSFSKGGKDGESSTPSTTILHSVTAQSGATNANADAFLGKGSKVVGTLTFSGPVEIDGQIEGELIAQDRLTIGEAAVINAKITGGEVIVRGTVNGDITASKRLIIKKPAKVTGNLTTSNLTIEEGVVFEGKCQMSVPAMSGEKKKMEAVAGGQVGRG